MKNTDITEDALVIANEVAKRRDSLGVLPPLCPKCQDEQVQLVSWKWVPAKWRCRICKHRFIYEPDVAGAIRSLRGKA